MINIKNLILRPADKVIGINYLERWHLIPRNRFLNIYLHKFSGSDDDRALHDHPWVSVSFLLKGTLTEVMPHPLAGHDSRHCVSRVIRRFVPVFRRSVDAHRLVVDDGPVLTLFITGPRIRQWGFWCQKGWVHWRQFCDESGLRRGAGCGE